MKEGFQSGCPKRRTLNLLPTDESSILPIPTQLPLSHISQFCPYYLLPCEFSKVYLYSFIFPMGGFDHNRYFGEVSFPFAELD